MKEQQGAADDGRSDVFLVHTTKLHSPNLGRYLYYSIATVIRAALLLLDMDYTLWNISQG